MKDKLVFKNIIASVFLQFATIISGFILPKIIITLFGSEVNGLISSINQFLNYIMLLEGGIGSVIMASLYKPLLEKNNEKISAVINTAQAFFRKIALIYLAYVVIIAFVYPIFVKTQYTYLYVCGLVFVLAINLFVQYFFSISFRLLLNADRRVYFVNFLQGIIVILNMIAIVVVSKLFNDILLLKLISALVFCIIPIVYNKYIKMNYNIDCNVKTDENTIAQRWDGFGINLAFFIHSNTDIVILTFFSTLENVSVYAIYFMIVNALRNLTISMSSAIAPSFGRVFAEGNEKKSNDAFDVFQFGMFFVTTILFSCGIVLITPFVSIYTNGVYDANYYQPIFGIVLMVSEMIYCLRDPLVSVAYTSGNFKPIAKYAYIEAAINIILSLLLVNRFGLVGIAVGTTVAMFYRMIMQAVFASKHVIHRSIRKFIKEIVVFGTTTVIICLFALFFINVNNSNYLYWIINAIELFLFATTVTTVVSVIFFKTQFVSIIRRFIRH